MLFDPLAFMSILLLGISMHLRLDQLDSSNSSIHLNNDIHPALDVSYRTALTALAKCNKEVCHRLIQHSYRLISLRESNGDGFVFPPHP